MGFTSAPSPQRFDQGEAEVIGLRLRDGTILRVTPDHKVMTDTGWREAGELSVGDRLARPRSFMGFGEAEPVTPDHARLLGYLIGDGYVGGKLLCAFINVEPSLHDDVALDCGLTRLRLRMTGRGGYEAVISTPQR